VPDVQFVQLDEDVDPIDGLYVPAEQLVQLAWPVLGL